MLYSIHLQLNPGPARAGQYSTPNLAAMFHEVPLQQVFYPLPKKELITGKLYNPMFQNIARPRA